jgi:glutathione peroxidase
MTEAIYDFTLKTLGGDQLALDDYRDCCLLLVNTASQCGFTPQYAELEALHRDYAHRGFSVIGFPCNQFGKQEPGAAADIAHFCNTHYGVTFPLSEKIDVNGTHAHPIFRFLKRSAPGILGTEVIKWNFTKFLVDRKGRVMARFGPTTRPDSLRNAIEGMLREN